MGFRPGRVFDLRFEGDMEGAEVKIRSGSIADMNALTTLGTTEIGEVIDIFLKYAVSWNFEHPEDGFPLPLEKEAIEAYVDEATIVPIIRAWWRASTAVPDPLDRKSTNGSPSVELSIPTETL